MHIYYIFYITYTVFVCCVFLGEGRGGGWVPKRIAITQLIMCVPYDNSMTLSLVLGHKATDRVISHDKLSLGNSPPSLSSALRCPSSD